MWNFSVEGAKVVSGDTFCCFASIDNIQLLLCWKRVLKNSEKI